MKRSKPLGRQLIEKAIDELLIKAARLAREKAEQLPPGEEREDLLKKVRQAETGASSPGLQPSK